MKSFIKDNWFKILAIAILVGAFWNQPYFYYQVLRWFTTICSVYLAYYYSQKKKMVWMWIFVSMAVLFNPIFPFYFSKGTWQIFDLIGALIFLLPIFIKK